MEGPGIPEPRQPYTGPENPNMDFKEVLLFLQDFSWVWNFKVTELLTEAVLSAVPSCWSQLLRSTPHQLFAASLLRLQGRSTSSDGINPEEDPQLVKEFLTRLNKVQTRFSKVEYLDKQAKKAEDSRGLSVKKLHEVDRFSAFIKERCRNSGIQSIVDVGSGLGYLDERLLSSGLGVTGVEASPVFYQNAVKRHKENLQKKNRGKNGNAKDDKKCAKSFSESSCSKTIVEANMKHVNLKVDDSEPTLQVLEAAVEENSSLVALHGCGDLAPDILKIFLKSDKFRSVAIVTCCYHKVKRKESFPLSQELLSVAGDFDFNVFFRRLAAQETVARWEKMTPLDHENHVRNVIFRSSLEIFAQQEGLHLKKNRRKAVKKDDILSFHQFMDSLSHSYSLLLSDEERIRLERVYTGLQDQGNLVENLTALQYLLQPCLEALILCDLSAFLKEEAKLKQNLVLNLFNEFISPRNKVLFAEKF